MNNKIKFSISLSIIACSIFLLSCNKELDVAPYVQYDGKANCTIAKLLTYHVPGSTDSFDSIPKGIVISGIVTSSDEAGNCYKFLNIEDETGGIQVKIANTALYKNYPLGQRVFVECDGLVLGDYRKQHQLGWWENNGMEYIPATKEDSYLFRDGIPTSLPKPSITITSAKQLSERYYNCLIKIDSCSFVDAGTATYSEPSASTSRDIKLKDGSTIVLRTSNYASFAQTKLPKGTGCIIGILTRYNTTNQLVIRSLSDVIGFSSAPTYTENIILQMPMDNEHFAKDWQNVGSGDLWNCTSTSMFTGLYINGSGSATDRWLVSTALSDSQGSLYALNGYHGIKLYFDHRCVGSGNNTIMKCYYTTTAFTGSINENAWIELPISTFTSNFNTFSYSLPDNVTSNPNFRIAFRADDIANNSWYITNIIFKALVQESK